MAWKTTTKLYPISKLEGTDSSSAGVLAKDINDFLTANDGSTLSTANPQITITEISGNVLVSMSIENG